MFVQKPLGYGYDNLEPFISASIMELHYSKHHAAYVNNLNASLSKYNFINFSNDAVIELINAISLLPSDVYSPVRNNLGGHINHTLFWASMTAHSTSFSSLLLQKIIEDFGSLEKFWELFIVLSTTLFGSGWVWLAYNPLQDKLFLKQYANQESPLFESAYPILGLDVWEHAYYLDYKNNRMEYVKKWMSVVNGEYASILFERALTKKKFVL